MRRDPFVLRRVLALVLSAALLALPTTAAFAGLQEDVASARDAQDRQLKSAMAKGPQPLRRFVEAETKRADMSSAAIPSYLAGRALFEAGSHLEDRAMKMRSHKYLQSAWNREPQLWQAGMGLAMLYQDFKQPKEAEKVVAHIRQLAPREEAPLRFQVSLLLAEQRVADAIEPLETLHRLNPADKQVSVALLGALSEASRREEAIALFERMQGDKELGEATATRLIHLDNLMRTERLDEALVFLESLRGTALWRERPDLQREYAFILLDRRRDAQVALRELEDVSRRLPNDVRVLTALVDLRLVRSDLRGALEALERALPLLPEGEVRERAEGLAAALRDGRNPFQAPPRPLGPELPPTVEADSPYVELLRRCMDEDVAVRRVALRAYYEADLPVADPVVYWRIGAQTEPDADCRIWAARILGRFDAKSTTDPNIVREVAVRLASALEDPEGRVRRVAAEELARVGVKAAFIYLLPYFYGLPVETPPEEREAARLLESEYNAARMALVEATGHRDLPLTADRDWVPLAEAAAHREQWTAWIDGPEGIAAKLEALDDFGDVGTAAGDPVMRAWLHLVYGLSHVFSPSPLPVAKRTYRLLRDGRPKADAEMSENHRRLWADFPVLTDEEVEAATSEVLDDRVGVWWRGKMGLSTTDK